MSTSSPHDESAEQFTELLKLLGEGGHPQFSKAVLQAVLDFSEHQEFLTHVVKTGVRKLVRPLLRYAEKDADEELKNGSQKQAEQQRMLVLEAQLQTYQILVNLSAQSPDLTCCILELQGMRRLFDSLRDNYVVKLSARVQKQAEDIRAGAEQLKPIAEEGEAKGEAHAPTENDETFLENCAVAEIRMDSLQVGMMLLSNLSGSIVERERSSLRATMGETQKRELFEKVAPGLVNWYLAPPLKGTTRDLFYHIGPTLKNLCLVSAGRKVVGNPMLLAPLAVQLIARHRRRHVLEIYLHLAVDTDRHPDLANSQFLPQMCCYLCSADKQSAPGDSAGGVVSTTPEQFHPVVASSPQGLTDDAAFQETALQILFLLGKSEAGSTALTEQRVLPVVREWRANLQRQLRELDAELKSPTKTRSVLDASETKGLQSLKDRLTMVEIVHSLLKAAATEGGIAKDIEFENPLFLQIDKNGEFTSLGVTLPSAGEESLSSGGVESESASGPVPPRADLVEDRTTTAGGSPASSCEGSGKQVEEEYDDTIVDCFD